jgi:hypothetical protein
LLTTGITLANMCLPCRSEERPDLSSVVLPSLLQLYQRAQELYPAPASNKASLTVGPPAAEDGEVRGPEQHFSL